MLLGEGLAFKELKLRIGAKGGVEQPGRWWGVRAFLRIQATKGMPGDDSEVAVAFARIA
jgi:hypothetical protein